MKLDRYSFFARLLPALFAVLPLAVFLVFVWPDSHEAWEHIKAIGFSVLVYALLAQFGRDFGKRLEPKLFEGFGGKPSTTLLRHRDERLDATTKARYHKYLSNHVPDIKMPTKEDENTSPDEADRMYNSAAAWLRVNTRHDPLLLEENISYGMRRNMLGLKLLGIIICLAASIIVVGNNYTQNTMPSGPEYAVLILSAGMLAIWIFVVKASWVQVPADAYARRLLENCDKSNQHKEITP